VADVRALWQSWTLKRHLGSGRKKGALRQSAGVCASRKRRTKTFLGWRTDSGKDDCASGEMSARAGKVTSRKYRKLVPTLALMNHLADRGEGAGFPTRAAQGPWLPRTISRATRRGVSTARPPRARLGSRQGPSSSTSAAVICRTVFHRTGYSSAQLGTPDRARSCRPSDSTCWRTMSSSAPNNPRRGRAVAGPR